jgi:Papain family cysteine protease
VSPKFFTCLYRPEWIWQYAKEQIGIVKESSYTLYNSISTGTCVAGKTRDARAEVDYWVTIPTGDEEAMKCRLALHGPIHVSISIEKTSLMTYKSGIWDDPEKSCTPSRNIDHAVTLVGYGTELSQTGVQMDYWIIQNSWGTSYGTSGFMKIRRGVNLCLVATDAMYPVLKTASPQPLTPIYTPTDCDVMQDVFSSTGVYIKSLCVDIYWQDYEASRLNCLARGMRLYQLDSTDATAGVLNAATAKWTTASRQYNDLYVYGNTASVCTNINNKNPFGPVNNMRFNALPQRSMIFFSLKVAVVIAQQSNKAFVSSSNMAHQQQQPC